LRHARTAGAGWMAALAAGALWACGGSGARPPSGAGGIGVGGQGGSISVMGTTACLDRPDELPRTPTAELPCELIPPGLRL